MARPPSNGKVERLGDLLGGVYTQIRDTYENQGVTNETAATGSD